MLNEDFLGIVFVTFIWLMIDPNVGYALTDKTQLFVITSPRCTIFVYIPVYRVVFFLFAGVRIYRANHELQRYAQSKGVKV